MSILSSCFTEGNYALVNGWDNNDKCPTVHSVSMIACTPFLLSVTAGEVFSSESADIMPFTKNTASIISDLVCERGWQEHGFDILATRLSNQFKGVQKSSYYYDNNEVLGFDGMRVELYDLGKDVFRESIVERGFLLSGPKNQ